MNVKKLGVAMITLLACAALTASGALAAAVTTDATWLVGSSGTVLSGSETVSATGTNSLVWHIGTTPFELSSTGLNCLSCTIQNTAGTAVGSGSLEFTGVTAKSSPACAARNVGGTTGIIKTNALEIKADYMIGTSNYILFKPVGSSTLFFELELLKGSGSCSLAGKYKVTGEVFVKSVNGTGVYEATQKVESSRAINEEASGKTEPLQFGGVAAVLNGSATFALSGARKGEVFGTHE